MKFIRIVLSIIEKWFRKFFRPIGTRQNFQEPKNTITFDQIIIVVTYILHNCC